MRTITRPFRRIAILFTFMTIALAAIPLAGAAQDSAENLKERCKDGGWQTLTRADGTPFENQGECVKYIESEDGTFPTTEEPPPPETGLHLKVWSGVFNGTSCQYLVHLGGLTPESGRFELWMKFGDLPWRYLPMAGGWNGLGIYTYHDLSQVPSTFTVYVYGAERTGDPIDSVTISSCGESNY